MADMSSSALSPAPAPEPNPGFQQQHLSQPTSAALAPEQGQSNVILPPTEIRKIVDRTAAFVARNDKAFEDKVRESKFGNPQFSFLNPGDPYHAYYRSEVARNAPGHGDFDAPVPGVAAPVSNNAFPPPAVATPPPPPPPPKPVPVAPPPYQFKLDLPPISAQDLDIIKLTATFVARNGPQFRAGLAQREGRNYQFDFLKPGHSLFGYFNRLVEQYSYILLPAKQTLTRLAEAQADKYGTLQRAMARVEYSQYEEAQRKNAAEKEDQERAAYASIDWHDFVVVQTLEFTETDQGIELPPPLRVEDFAGLSLSARRSGQVDHGEAEEVEEVEEVAKEPSKKWNEEEAIQAEIQPPTSISATSESSTPGPAFATPTVPLPAAPNAPVKIRKDYVPKALGPRTQEATQACPICGLSFPMSEIDEHIRVESLDPKWKEQKAILEARQRDSNLLRSGNEVTKNLKRLSTFRSDLFGSDEVAIGRKIEEDAERRKQAEKEVFYDGFSVVNPAAAGAAPGTQSRVGQSLDVQIAAIHRKANTVITPANMSQPGPQQPNQSTATSSFQPYIPTTGVNNPPPLHYPHQPLPPPPPPPQFFNAPPPFPLHPHHQEMFGAPPPQMQPPLYYPPPSAFMGMEMDPKRFKVDDPMSQLVPEHQWATMHPSSFKLQVDVPNDPNHPEWNLNGQTLWLENLSASTTIQQVKDKLAELLSFPASKQKVSVYPAHPNAGSQVAKNTLTLAAYNVPPNSKIDLAIKERGGKK